MWLPGHKPFLPLFRCPLTILIDENNFLALKNKFATYVCSHKQLSLPIFTWEMASHRICLSRFLCSILVSGWIQWSESRSVVFWLSETPWTQARILEWVAIPFSRASSWPRDQIQVSRIAGRLFTIWAIRELYIIIYVYVCVCVYIGASLVAQLVKNLPAIPETWVRSPDQEDPLEKGMAAHSSILDWKIPWTEEPGGYSPWGRRVRHEAAAAWGH